MAASHDLRMVDKVRNLHRPILVKINGEECPMLTIGYVALALRRTTWTIKYWQRIGLLPRDAFVLNPNSQSARRRLFPEQYVQRLDAIGRQYLGPRMDRDQWATFRRLAFEAFEETVAPLLGRNVGVTDNGPA
jgi:hypothetical protein